MLAKGMLDCVGKRVTASRLPAIAPSVAPVPIARPIPAVRSAPAAPAAPAKGAPAKAPAGRPPPPPVQVEEREEESADSAGRCWMIPRGPGRACRGQACSACSHLVSAPTPVPLSVPPPSDGDVDIGVDELISAAPTAALSSDVKFEVLDEPMPDVDFEMESLAGTFPSPWGWRSRMRTPCCQRSRRPPCLGPRPQSPRPHRLRPRVPWRPRRSPPRRLWLRLAPLRLRRLLLPCLKRRRPLLLHLLPWRRLLRARPGLDFDVDSGSAWAQASLRCGHHGGGLQARGGVEFDSDSSARAWTWRWTSQGSSLRPAPVARRLRASWFPRPPHSPRRRLPRPRCLARFPRLLLPRRLRAHRPPGV